MIAVMRKIFRSFRYWLQKAQYTIPHPHEPANNGATVGTVDPQAVIVQWLDEWQVYDKPYWYDVEVNISTQYPVPAATSSQTRQMWVRPEWANAGVIAHEMAHISYWQLTPQQKYDFTLEFIAARKQDGLLKWVYEQTPYMAVDAIEGHADTYRYLGHSMPPALKGFYPHLL